MRLNRFLAASGLGSRRGVEELIVAGKVRVNGRVVEDLATKVGPDDTVKVGSRVLKVEEPMYAILHKPPGYVVTASDERDRRTIYDLLPPEWPRTFHVGRLDKDSEGLLIVTNDGDFSLALTHPRYKVEKEYEVTLDRSFDMAHREKLLRGFHIIGGRAKMEDLQQMGPKRLRVTLSQGIKRQVRLMFYELGYEVEQLVRIRIGSLFLGRLKPGEWRRLSPKEVKALREEAQPKAVKAAAASTSPTKPARPLSEIRPKRITASGKPQPERRRPAATRRSDGEDRRPTSVENRAPRARTGPRERTTPYERAPRSAAPRERTAPRERAPRAAAPRSRRREQD